MAAETKGTAPEIYEDARSLPADGNLTPRLRRTRVILDLYWGNISVVLGEYWCYIGVILG